MNLDWKHYTVAVLLLAALAAWGSRERTWTKQVDQLTKEKTTLTENLAKQKTENESLRRETDATEVTEPMIVKVNGKDQVVMVTRKTSRTVEVAMRQATEQIAQFKQQVSELQMKLSTKETETVKPSPKWAVSLGWDPLADTETQRWRAGLGLNLGPLTALATAAPAGWIGGGLTDTRPQLEVVLRF